MIKTACALGFFDGVHKAHSRILTDCANYAKKHGLKSAAITFDISPSEYFGKDIKYLTSLSQKKSFMKSLGIDSVVVLKCSKSTLSMSPEEFISGILVTRLHAEAIFCGFNYTFGKGGMGNVQTLNSICKEKGLSLFVSQEMKDEKIRVSSSAIREELSLGNIERANFLLTRPFQVCGTVAEGKKLGRKLNFPTANIYAEKIPSLPRGVYATKTVVDSKEYISVSNVGINPTVGGEKERIETYILDFSEDIYGKDITVKFYKFLRPEQTFLSLDGLKQQIEKDKNSTIEFFTD